ncbi:MAG: hypothetical protein PUC82_04390 [bacterium]|nr:hypothetical protein [bacterium]
MQFIREHKKTSIIVMIFLSLFLLFEVTYAGYIRNILKNYILETKEFYFNSSVLNVNGKVHSINNWDGVNSYYLTIDLNSKKNEVKSTNSDIEYNITYECSSNVVCSVSKENGIIREDLKNDSYSIVVTPLSNLESGEQAVIKTYATSVSPYEKTLSATYIVGVLKSNFSYNIEDSVNSKYLVLNLTNSVGFYEVEEAFSNYAVGDLISLDSYTALSAADKEKCYSAKVTLTVPNDILALDMTNLSYLNKIAASEETVRIDNYRYVNKYTFKIDATSSEKVVFYKYDIGKNYTYPIVNNDSVIDVSVVLAE